MPWASVLTEGGNKFLDCIMLLYLVLVEEKYKPEKTTATHWFKQTHLAFQPTVPALTCRFPLVASQDYETATCLQFQVFYPTTVKLRFAKSMTTTPRNHPIPLRTLRLWDGASHGTYSAISIFLTMRLKHHCLKLLFSLLQSAGQKHHICDLT